MLRYIVDYSKENSDLGSLDIKLNIFNSYLLPADFINLINTIVKEWEKISTNVDK